MLCGVSHMMHSGSSVSRLFHDQLLILQNTECIPALQLVILNRSPPPVRSVSAVTFKPCSCCCCEWTEPERACRAHRLTAYISALYAVYYSPNMALILTLGEISLPKVGFFFLLLKMSRCDAAAH